METLMNEITFDDFLKIDIRTGTIVSAERVTKSNKLLKLQVNFGELGIRQIVTGIGKEFDPVNITGIRIVAVVNLQPRKLMGLESNGMILAVQGKTHLELVTVVAVEGAVIDGTKIG